MTIMKKIINYTHVSPSAQLLHVHNVLVYNKRRYLHQFRHNVLVYYKIYCFHQCSQTDTTFMKSICVTIIISTQYRQMYTIYKL